MHNFKEKASNNIAIQVVLEAEAATQRWCNKKFIASTSQKTREAELRHVQNTEKQENENIDEDAFSFVLFFILTRNYADKTYKY